MSDYSNENQGAIFKNDKQGNDKRPDYKGSLNVEGVDYWISCWLQKSKRDGTTFMSAKVERKDKQSAPAPKARPTVDDMADDSIPF